MLSDRLSRPSVATEADPCRTTTLTEPPKRTTNWFDGEPSELADTGRSASREILTSRVTESEARGSRRETIQTHKRTTGRFYQPPQFHYSVLETPTGSETSHVENREHRAGTYTELFLDLVFAIPLACLTLTTPTSANFYVFIAQYLAVVNSWLAEAWFNSRFDTDDLIVRLMTLIRVMSICEMAYGIQHESGTHLAIGYITMHFVLIVQYGRAATNSESFNVQRLCLGHVAGLSSSVVLWLAALWTAHGMQYALFLIGLLIDILTPFVLLRIVIPVHPHHMPARLAAYTIIVISVMTSIGTAHIISSTRTTGWRHMPCIALIGVLPFSMMTLYTNVIGVPVGMDNFFNSIWDRVTTYCYFYLHIPFTGCLIYVTMVLAHMDCNSGNNGMTPVLGLTNPPTHLCLGLSAALFFLGVHHLSVEGSRSYRTVTRISCSVLLTPLAYFGNKMSDEWCLLVVSTILLVQMFLEYAYFEDSSLGRVSMNSSLLGELLNSSSSSDPTPLLSNQLMAELPELGVALDEPVASTEQVPRLILELETVLSRMEEEHRHNVKQIENEINGLKAQVESL